MIRNKTAFALKAIIAINHTGSAKIENIDAHSIEKIAEELEKFYQEHKNIFEDFSITTLLLSKEIYINWQKH